MFIISCYKIGDSCLSSITWNLYGSVLQVLYASETSCSYRKSGLQYPLSSSRIWVASSNKTQHPKNQQALFSLSLAMNRSNQDAMNKKFKHIKKSTFPEVILFTALQFVFDHLLLRISTYSLLSNDQRATSWDPYLFYWLSFHLNKSLINHFFNNWKHYLNSPNT